jgi:hypothetical protein
VTIETAHREPLSTGDANEEERGGVRKGSSEVGARRPSNPQYAAQGTLKCVAPATLECVDVRTLGRFRVEGTEDRVAGTKLDPWNFEILCARWKGRIYPHGGTRLQAWITTRRVKGVLAALLAVGATPWQVGDHEATVLFEVADFERVAAVLRPRKKRPGPAKGTGTATRF